MSMTIPFHDTLSVAYFDIILHYIGMVLPWYPFHARRKWLGGCHQPMNSFEHMDR